jgi:hypothetical protein
MGAQGKRWENCKNFVRPKGVIGNMDIFFLGTLTIVAWSGTVFQREVTNFAALQNNLDVLAPVSTYTVQIFNCSSTGARHYTVNGTSFSNGSFLERYYDVVSRKVIGGFSGLITGGGDVVVARGSLYDEPIDHHGEIKSQRRWFVFPSRTEYLSIRNVTQKEFSDSVKRSCSFA